MTDQITPDGAPLLEPETPPSLPDFTIETTGSYRDGTFYAVVKTDTVILAADIKQEGGFEHLELLLAAFPSAVEQIIERLFEAMEADESERHEASNDIPADAVPTTIQEG